MKKGYAAILVLGMVLLIIDTRTAFIGATEGINLCLSSVIPALLPFWVLSSLLTGCLWGSKGKAAALMGRLFSIPQGAESVLIPAFLGGYPAGAGCIAAAFNAGKLQKSQAERLLGYCNNVGPAFLFGIVAPQLGSVWQGLYLWGLTILGAWTASQLLPGKNDEKAAIGRLEQGDPFGDAAAAMGKICVCVILFRVILAYTNKYLPSSGFVAVVYSGILELTNGCCGLSRLPMGMRLPLAAGLCSLGGLCVALQTASVAKGLSLSPYLLGKVIAALISTAGARYPWSLMIPVCFILLKKWVAFFKKPVYNGGNLGSGRTLCFSERK